MQTEEPGGDYASRLHGWEGHFHCPHGNDGPGLAEGLADKLDKGSADGVGLNEGPGVGTDDGAGLAEGLAELGEHRSEVGALQAELDEGAADRRQGRQGTRPATKKADDKIGIQATR